jgi:hypothetical protein
MHLIFLETKSMKIAFFLLLLIAQQSYGQQRCGSTRPVCPKAIACYGNVNGRYTCLGLVI